MYLYNNKHFNNVLVSSLPGILSIFLSFFSIPLFLNLLSADYYANYLIQHFILSLGMVLNLNLGKFASIKIQRSNIIKRKEIIFTTIVSNLVLGAVLSAIVYYIIYFFFNDKSYFNVSISLFIGLLLTILYIGIEHIIKGLGYFRLCSITNFLFYSLSLSLPAFFLLIGNHNVTFLNNLFNISLGVKFFGLLCLLFFLIKKKELILTKISLRLFKEFRTHAKWMTITSFYNQIYDYLDKHIIKINLGSIMLITYAVPQQIAAKLTIFSHAIIAVILPKISLQKNDKQRKKILSANLYLFFVLTSLVLIVLLPFYDSILNWWLKSSYNLDILKLFKIFILLTFLSCLSNIIVAFYEATLVSKKNTIYETISILPFCIGLAICLYYQNIFLFAFLLLFKEFIMLYVRISSVKEFIIDYRYLNIEILLFFSTFILSFFEYYQYAYLSGVFFVLIIFFKLPIKTIKKEFFKL